MPITKKCATLALILFLSLSSLLSAQNSAQRSTMNNEIDDYFSRNKLPGLAVLYAKNGSTSYERLKGHSNMEKGYPLKKTHVMRHASVSKLFAAVLALKLEEKGKLNLNKKVRFYLPDLPEHHDYRVIDLLTCRSGVRHYGGKTSPQSPKTQWGDQKYQYSRDVIGNFMHDPLVDKSRSYVYSTHGYTIAAAVMEKVTGKPISVIIKDELSSPYQLYSLAAEDKTVYRSARVRLYQYDEKDSDRNRRVIRDHISWKTLGGGLESSPQDLLRFMVLLGDGKIISKKNVKRLMKRVDPHNSYAIGCTMGVVNGVPLLAKDGGQLGASTFVWLAPKTRQAMVVMINRREKANAPSLAKKLLNIVMSKGSENSKPDLIVSSFERTGKVVYQNGKLHIPVRMKIKNVGQGPTYKQSGSNYLNDKFVTAVRVGSKYYMSKFQGSMTGGEETGWITGTVSISDKSKFYAGRTLKLYATADAPVAAADTSVSKKGRVIESNDQNNAKLLSVKVPGGTNGFKNPTRPTHSGSKQPNVGGKRRPFKKAKPGRQKQKAKPGRQKRTVKSGRQKQNVKPGDQQQKRRRLQSRRRGQTRIDR